jgi:hypothetical protein
LALLPCSSFLPARMHGHGRQLKPLLQEAGLRGAHSLTVKLTPMRLRWNHARWSFADKLPQWTSILLDLSGSLKPGRDYQSVSTRVWS